MQRESVVVMPVQVSHARTRAVKALGDAEADPPFLKKCERDRLQSGAVSNPPEVIMGVN
jgi:hypothetical protein